MVGMLLVTARLGKRNTHSHGVRCKGDVWFPPIRAGEGGRKNGKPPGTGLPLEIRPMVYLLHSGNGKNGDNERRATFSGN